MHSIWQDKSEFKTFNELTEDIKTDVLIIGGGIAGILLAYELSNRGVNYTLLEAGSICNSVTPNTTAKITSQHGLIYSKIEKEFNTDYAKLYFEANNNALKKYMHIAEKYECDFEIKDSYVYSTDNYTKIENELKTLQKFTDIAAFSNNLDIPLSIAGAVKFEKQAQFNPLMLLSKISEKLNIYENTKVFKIDGNTALTDKGRVTADSIVICSHFPFINKYGLYFMKMYQHKSYVIALKNAPDIDGMYVDDDENGLSFRNYGDYLLLGGVGHRTGDGKCGWNTLQKFACIHYPNSEKAYQWATQDCITLDGIAYIGKYSNIKSNLYVSTGYNKWGMTTSMVSAELLADILEGKHNDYEKLYSPSRSILRSQLTINTAKTVKSLCTFSKMRCTHLGCALNWNKDEHIWECSCHGSSFDSNGNVLQNPAIKKLK